MAHNDPSVCEVAYEFTHKDTGAITRRNFAFRKHYVMRSSMQNFLRGETRDVNANLHFGSALARRSVEMQRIEFRINVLGLGVRFLAYRNVQVYHNAK